MTSVDTAVGMNYLAGSLRLAVFNVKFSNNLGDGIVAETTEYLLRQLAPGAAIRTLDLGGRAAFGSQGIQAPLALKQLIHRALHWLPGQLSGRLRASLTRIALKRQALSLWREQIARADRVIIGGGQLIADTDLYFPIRLQLIAQLAQELGKPMFIHAVGVSDPESWSPLARQMFNQAFSNNPGLVYVSVRDQASCQYWRQAFGGSPVVVADPGNFAAATYPVAAAESPLTANRVGVGVMAAEVVYQHTGAKDARLLMAVEDYVALGRALCALGKCPVFFTNGALEDEACLTRVRSLWQRQGGDLAEFMPSPRTPADLVACVARCERLIAYRLHACIIAVSLGKPVLGLAWDKKLHSYFAGLGAAAQVACNPDPLALAQQLNQLQPLALACDLACFAPLVAAPPLLQPVTQAPADLLCADA